METDRSKEAKRSFIDRHFRGAGGIFELLPIAIPMILTSIFDTLMTFIDRLYLSYVGKEHISACMIGGTSSWLCVTLFVGLIGYSSAVVAHYYGAKRYSECPRVTFQALLLGAVSYPVILLIGLLVSHLMGGKGHDPYQLELERVYYWYMIFGCVLSLSRGALASFFAGIGKTTVIMVANFVALLVNLLGNYLLIFGKWGCPRLGIAGAAIGTLLAGLAMVVVIGYWFFHTIRQKPYSAHLDLRPDFAKLKTLLRYGFPTGLENMLCMGSFVFMLSVFHSFGADMATATTIVFNWDNVSFWPLIGLQIGVTALVGQHLGAKEPALAERAAHSGYKLALTYSSLAVLVFVTCTPYLVHVFTPDVEGVDYSQVKAYAIPMLRLASLYLVMDAVYLISSGALRGAGDTLWVMVAGFLVHWWTSGSVWIGVHVFHVSCIGSWVIYVLLWLLSGLVMYSRFRKGNWKKIQMISDEVRIEAELGGN